jgi:hypothetical protein
MPVVLFARQILLDLEGAFHARVPMYLAIDPVRAGLLCGDFNRF